jgi:hypothetical protein
MTQAKSMTDSFVKMNAAGAFYTEGLSGQLDAAQRAGLTMDQLGNVVVANTDAFAKMGLGVGEGSRRLTQVFDQNTKAGKELRTGLFALGISAEDQANMAVQVMSMMAGPSGRLKASNEEVAQRTQEYAANLKLLADLTGEDMKAKQDAIRQENDNLAFQQVLDGMADGGAALKESMLAMSDVQRKGVRESMIYGQVRSTDVALAMATNKGLANTTAAFTKMAKDGTINVDRTLKVQTDNADLLHESAMKNKGLAIAGISGNEAAAKASADQLKTDQLVRSLQKAKTDEEKKAILKQIEDAQKGKGKPEEKILQANQDLATAMQGLARDSIPDIADAVKTTTAGIEESIGAFQKFLKGTTAASSFDNALLLSAVGGLLPVITTMILGKIAGGGWLGGFGGGKGGGGLAGKAGNIAGGAAEAAGGAVGGGLGKLGDGLKGLGSGLGGGIRGLLVGIGEGLAAMTPAIPVILTLTAAVWGIGKALEAAAPGIDAFGRAMKLAFEGAGTFVNNMGTAIKSVSEGIATVITSIGTAAVDVAKALTASIKELSGVSALKLVAVAGGIFAIAGSMTAFGLGGALAKLVSGDGKFDGMVAGIRMFEEINADKLRDVADGMKKLKDSMPDVTDLIKLAGLGLLDRFMGKDKSQPVTGGVAANMGSGGNLGQGGAGAKAGGVQGGGGGGTGAEAGGGRGSAESYRQVFSNGGTDLSAGGGATSNTDTGGVSSANGIMDLIGRLESGGSYTKLVGGKDQPDLTKMTINEVMQLQNKMLGSGFISSAVGKYQIIKSTMAGLIKKLGLDPETTKFDPATQDKMAMALGEARGLGKLPKGDTLHNMAKEWASLPAGPDNKGFYDGQNSNKSLVRWDDAIKLMAKGGITDGPSIAGEAGPEAVVPLPDGKNIPVNLDMSALVDKMEEMIRVMKDHKSTSDRILQASV